MCSLDKKNEMSIDNPSDPSISIANGLIISTYLQF